MSRTGFYNDNANRSYPFVRGSTFGPNSAVVDCGFQFGPGAGFTHGESSVYLTMIERIGDIFVFTFNTSAANTTERTIKFVRNVDDADYTNEFSDTLDNQDLLDSNSESSSESIQHDCNYADGFIGWLVTGPLEDLREALPTDGRIIGQARVEPAQIQNSGGAYVRSLNLANGDRTRYDTPDQCKDQCWPDPPQPLWIVDTCVQGPLRFREGYNSRISQDTTTNAITFDAIVAAGAGEPCDPVPLHPAEELPHDSIFLEGGPACNEVIRSINGVGGRVVNVKGGPGVRATPLPNKNTIVINVDTHDLAVCLPYEELPSLSEVSVSEPDCACGPK